MPAPKGWKRKKLADWRRVCAKGSMRTVKSGKARIFVCCPKGAWDSKRKRCKIGTRAVSIDKPSDRVAFGAAKKIRVNARELQRIIRERPQYVEPKLLPLPSIKKFKPKRVDWGEFGGTEKQTRYVMFLLKQNGYSTRFMDSRFKALGATMRERSGSVESWVRGLDVGRASELINRLKK